MRHWFTFSILVLSMLANGCADDGSSLFIVRNLSLDDECIAAEGNPGRSSGVLDVASIPLGNGYRMSLLLGAQLVERASDRDVNPFDLTVTGIDVALEDDAGNTLPLGGLANPYRVRANAFIEAFSGTGTLPTGIASLEVIPPTYIDQIAREGITRVSVSLRPLGMTAGGIDVEGAFLFSYPLRLCTGCLNGCFLPDDEPVAACRPGQDEVSQLTMCM